MIRLFIVDEIQLMVDVLKSALEDEGDFTIVGHTTSADAVRAQLDDTPTDIVLVSATLPQTAVLDVIHAAKEKKRDAQVVVLGLPDIQDQILAFIECGADGYVLRHDSIDSLLETIRAVHQGTPQVADDVVAALMKRVNELSTFCKEVLSNLDGVNLTEREREVLALVAQGHTNAAIADELCVEVGTVKTHVHHILRKLNVDNRKEAAKYFPLLASPLAVPPATLPANGSGASNGRASS